MKKLLSVLLTGSLAIGTLTGCGSADGVSGVVNKVSEISDKVLDSTKKDREFLEGEGWAIVDYIDIPNINIIEPRHKLARVKEINEFDNIDISSINTVDDFKKAMKSIINSKDGYSLGFGEQRKWRDGEKEQALKSVDDNSLDFKVNDNIVVCYGNSAYVVSKDFDLLLGIGFADSYFDGDEEENSKPHDRGKFEDTVRAVVNVYKRNEITPYDGEIYTNLRDVVVDLSDMDCDKVLENAGWTQKLTMGKSDDYDDVSFRISCPQNMIFNTKDEDRFDLYWKPLYEIDGTYESQIVFTHFLTDGDVINSVDDLGYLSDDSDSYYNWKKRLYEDDSLQEYIDYIEENNLEVTDDCKKDYLYKFFYTRFVDETDDTISVCMSNMYDCRYTIYIYQKGTGCVLTLELNFDIAYGDRPSDDVLKAFVHSIQIDSMEKYNS